MTVWNLILSENLFCFLLFVIPPAFPLFAHVRVWVGVGVYVCRLVRKREREQGNDLWFNSLESQLRSIIQTSEEEKRPVVLYRKTKTDRSGERQALKDLFWELFSQFWIYLEEEEEESISKRIILSSSFKVISFLFSLCRNKPNSWVFVGSVV